MLANQGRQQILQILTEERRVMSGELSQRFNVSEDSIRRDLCELAAEGRLQRVHGGALPISAAIAPVETRKSVQAVSKQAVARAAAVLIQSGQVVIIDGGTTTVAMIGFLPTKLNYTVITHSPGIAVTLADHPRIKVILLGSEVLKHSVVAVDAETLAGITRINADLLFMGVTGIHPRAGFTTGDCREAGIKCTLTARAVRIVVMASREKLNAASAFVIGELSLASTLIVDGESDAALRQQLVQCGVEIIPIQRQRRQGAGLNCRRTSGAITGRTGSAGCP